MALTKLQMTLRKNVIESLKLLSSRDEQLDYQRRVPIAYVSAEIFCIWDESYSEEWRKDKSFRPTFSKSELAAMEAFNMIFEDISDSLPKNPPDIEEFVLTPEWKKLSEAASTALLSFNRE